MWFLYQIKRFFSIFWKESFLFIKQKIEYRKKYPTDKIKLFQKKKTPILNKELEIKLDKKTYDFYSLQPKQESPFYNNSPLFLIIQKNKKKILNNLLEIFNYLYDFKLKIGIELEFYLLNSKKNTISDLQKALPSLIIEMEKGCNQFEIKTKPYIDIRQLVNDYNNIISTLKNFAKKNELKLDLSSTPFENDCGSALQINLSIVDNNGKNLFARNGEKEENSFTLNVIASLLKNINSNLLLNINDENCLKRFDLERNKKLKSGNKYPAPTFVCWGINNRTAAIRIPTPSSIDLKKYTEEDNKNRRIEYRIPSANADIYLVLIGIISSVIEGIQNNLIPHIEKTSFDVLEKNSALEPIENDFNNLNDIFKIYEDILFY